MYVLAKLVQEDKDAWTIHGLTESEEVSDAWAAAGHPVFEIDPADKACFDYYAPLKAPQDDEE